jgi:hypothetical protein
MVVKVFELVRYLKVSLIAICQTYDTRCLVDPFPPSMHEMTSCNYCELMKMSPEIPSPFR